MPGTVIISLQAVLNDTQMTIIADQNSDIMSDMKTLLGNPQHQSLLSDLE